MLLGEENAAYDNSRLNADNSTDDGYMFYEGNRLAWRHNEGSILAFLDGHSKRYRPEQVANSYFQTGGIAGAQCP